MLDKAQNLQDTPVNISRATKKLITISVDSLLVVVAFWTAILLRTESVDGLSQTKYWTTLLILLPISITIFTKFGLYRAILRYISSNSIWSILLAVSVTTAALVIIDFFLSIGLSKTIPIIFFAILLSLIGCSRLMLRAMVVSIASQNKIEVIIYGAGSAGRQLVMGLVNGSEYKPVAFVDDNVDKQGAIIQGIPVIGMQDLESTLKVSEVNNILLALPSLSNSARKQILQKLERYSVKVQTMPCLKDIIEGRAETFQIQDVEVDDLLGRDPVEPVPELMTANIYEKVVMVTGAGGSIGSELCRQIIRMQPSTLVLFELSEYALYAIHQEIESLVKDKHYNVEIVPLIGSVQRINRIENVMSAFKVNTVYHAAAYKHVPLVENNTVEGVRNNIFGTMYAAKAAINAKVETFVLVSTDKAVRPTNVMGASKRMAELVLQALSAEQDITRFTMVRFGNVLGSSGSVVPLFRKQIKSGGPVTVTHNDITRYFMTIPEAAQLVIQAGAMGKGGDVFVLDMGEPVKIRNLAVKLIRLSGLEVKDKLNPYGDIEIECTGLRPGEKLYEELLIGDDVKETFHERIMSANEVMLPWSQLENLITELDSACHNFEHDRIRQLLINAPTAYAPNSPICDLLAKAKSQAKAAPELKVVDILKSDNKKSS